MNTHTYNQTRGFTLIEILLYLALVMIMLAVLGAIGIDVLGSRAKATAQQEMHYASVFAHEKLRNTIARSEAIALPIRGENGSVLELSMPTPEQDPTIFSVVEGVLYMQEGVSAPNAITPAAIVVSEVLFSNVGDEAVRSAMHLDAHNPHMRSSYAASSTFYSTTRLRY
jgi:type II secretory pathway pseudopilin PulG